jgi:hypothetical protein
MPITSRVAVLAADENALEIKEFTLDGPTPIR